MALPFQSDVLLAPYTTLDLGGPAREFLHVRSVEMLQRALSSTQARGPVLILGGGSNLVVSDAGFDGLVLHLGMRGIEAGNEGRLRVLAGEPWEHVVASAVARGWAGLECLGGIPGYTGATPVQNVGAYGQDVSQVICSVEVLDLAQGTIAQMSAEQCGFGYRESRFKREPGRWVITAVEFQLKPGGAPTIGYRELERALADQRPTLRLVHETVLALRRRKSMVVDPNDPESRSAGSFFTNPVVGATSAAEVIEHAVSKGFVEAPQDVPRFDVAPDQVKFPAAWLIERAGIAKGTRRGGVGVSSKHALALVHHGGGTTAQLLDLAREVRDRVQGEFGIELVPEPRLVGTRW